MKDSVSAGSVVTGPAVVRGKRPECRLDGSSTPPWLFLAGGSAGPLLTCYFDQKNCSGPAVYRDGTQKPRQAAALCGCGSGSTEQWLTPGGVVVAADDVWAYRAGQRAADEDAQADAVRRSTCEAVPFGAV